MSVGDIEHRLAEMREFYPSDDHLLLDEAIETIKQLREESRKVSYGSRVRATLEELNPKAIFIDDMDEALVGYAVQWGSPPLAVYDGERIVEILSEDMGDEAAVDHFNYRIEASYLGPGTPLILYRPDNP